MKRSLGKVMFVAVMMVEVLWGGSYQWRVLEAPESLYVRQSGVVRYECAFSDAAGEYVIDFKPHGNERYDASILTQSDRIVSGKRIQSFDVLITPKEAGKLKVVLYALVRHTTFASIENATIGRDNVRKYDFKDENITLPETIIDAKANTSALSGQISMEVKVDKRSVIAREPVHVSLYLRGKGNLDQVAPYELNISGVNVFGETPQKTLSPSPEGYEGEVRQEFALVGDKSFVIPSISIEVFDPVTQKRKLLKSEAVSIDVAEGYERNNLLDPPQISDWSGWQRYTLYAGLMVWGALLYEGCRRLWKYLPRRRRKRFYDGVKTTKELIALLALKAPREYEEIIGALERAEISLSEAKKKLDTLTKAKEVKQ